MSGKKKLPILSAFRLAEYHCLLTETLKSGKAEKITSKAIAASLRLSEEIVRKDLSHIPDDIGTPGLGYEPLKLYKAISSLLHLDKLYDVCLIGNITTWRGVMNFFDPRKFSFIPKFVFSDVPSEKGLYFDQIPVHSIDDIPTVLKGSGVDIAIVACDVLWIRHVISLLIKVNIKGILSLTPALLDEVPENVHISQILLPCEIKLVAFKSQEDNFALKKRSRINLSKKSRLKRKK